MVKSRRAGALAATSSALSFPWKIGRPLRSTNGNPAVRPLDWRDLALVHRVRQYGLCLDARMALTRGPQLLQSALLDVVTPGRGACTWVAPHEDKPSLTAIGQFDHRHSTPLARLSFLAPQAAIVDNTGLRLLDRMAAEVGRRGGHHLLAEVEESSQVFERLRQAGFAVYARQRIWRLDEAPDVRSSAEWHTQTPTDSPAVHRLYLSLVPALVQAIEPPPESHGTDWILWHGRELHGYLEIESGPRGVWVQPFFHPAVEAHEQLLAAAFARLRQHAPMPLFVCVRSYQSWMNASLERLGLARQADQAVMVKRLAVPIRSGETARTLALDATRPEPTAPFAPSAKSGSHRLDRMGSG